MTAVPLSTTTGLGDLCQLLDEHHLAVLGEPATARRSLRRVMSGHLGGFPRAQVAVISGRRAVDLAGLGSALQRQIAPRSPVPGDLPALVDLLRRRPPGVRFRYVLWEDADEMLERDVRLFSTVVHALLSVAAEHEHANPEPLMLQRVVFFGGAKLGAYAEEEAGQFRRWLDGPAGEVVPEVSAWVSRPPVLVYRMDG